ncbi:MAG: AIPR family protein [Vulcanimicrobiota bacterium]
MCWAQLPHIASKGNQKNFLEFVQRQKSRVNEDWVPDQAYYKELVAKLILYRSAESIIRKEKMPAYRANIAAYLLARLSASGKIDLNAVWSRQTPSPALEQSIRDWTPRIYDCLVATAAGRNVTEWCKKPDCWAAVQELPLTAPTVSS